MTRQNNEELIAQGVSEGQAELANILVAAEVVPPEKKETVFALLKEAAEIRKAEAARKAEEIRQAASLAAV